MMYYFAQIIIFFVTPLLIVAAAVFDLIHMKIPNKLVLSGLGTFVLFAAASSLSPSTVAISVGVGLVVLLIGFSLFAAGVMGGGDAKFAAMAAMWLGASQVIEFLFIAALAGGALTLLMLKLKSVPVPIFGHSNPVWLTRLQDPKTGVPYGVALSFSALVLLPKSPLWAAAFAV